MHKCALHSIFMVHKMANGVACMFLNFFKKFGGSHWCYDQ